MKNDILAVVIDDEMHARNVISKFVESSGRPVKIVESFGNLPSAVEFLRENPVQLVFLDIQMPKVYGYEIVRYFDMNDVPFHIIFVTAFEKYAIRAFELSAVDYIVKPVQRNRLYEAMDKVIKAVNKTQQLTEYQALLQNFESKKKRLVIPEIDGKRVIDLDTIMCLQGQGSYSKIYLNNGTSVIVSKNLKTIADLFPDVHPFFRSQRSWLINLNHITRYNTNQQMIELDARMNVRLSKNKILEFQKALENNSAKQ